MKRQWCAKNILTASLAVAFVVALALGAWAATDKPGAAAKAPAEKTKAAEKADKATQTAPAPSTAAASEPAEDDEGCAALDKLDDLIADWEAKKVLPADKLAELKKIRDEIQDCAVVLMDEEDDQGEDSADSPPPPGEEVGFNGRWVTNSGIMDLTVTGDKVKGIYDQNEGEIEGTVSGNVLKGKWYESPTYKEPEDGGDIELTLSEDGKSFTGKWRAGSEGEWKTDWSGKRREQK